IRRPAGRLLYRARVTWDQGRELVLGRLPFLAARSRLYDETYYAASDRSQSKLYERLADAIVGLRSPASAVDVGCGSALLLAQRDARLVGVEGSRDAVRKARESVTVVRANLERGVPDVGRFDVCLCIEVAEHLRAKAGPSLVEGLARLSDTVVFTAAPPGQT